jgi:hypothetical protein
MRVSSSRVLLSVDLGALDNPRAVRRLHSSCSLNHTRSRTYVRNDSAVPDREADPTGVGARANKHLSGGDGPQAPKTSGRRPSRRKTPEGGHAAPFDQLWTIAQNWRGALMAGLPDLARGRDRDTSGPLPVRRKSAGVQGLVHSPLPVEKSYEISRQFISFGAIAWHTCQHYVGRLMRAATGQRNVVVHLETVRDGHAAIMAATFLLFIEPTEVVCGDRTWGVSFESRVYVAPNPV